MQFQAPKDFRTSDETLRADLQRQRQAIENSLSELDRDKEERWRWRRVKTASARADFWEALLVDVRGGATVIRLPGGSIQQSGKRVLVALSGTGNVTVLGDDTFVNGQSEDVLTLAGAYVYEFDGQLWWRMPFSSGLPPLEDEGDVLTIVGGVAAWAPPLAHGLAQYLDTSGSPTALWNFNGVITAAVGGSGYDLSVSTGNLVYTEAMPGLRGVVGGAGALRLVTGVGTALSQHIGALTVELLMHLETDTSVGRVVQAASSNTSVSSNTAWSVERVSATNFPLRWSVGQTFGAARTVSKQTSTMAYYPFNMQHVAFTRSANGQTWNAYQQGRLVSTLTGFTQPTAFDVQGAVGPEHRIVFGGLEQGVSQSLPACVIASCRISTTEKTAASIKAAYNQCLGPVYGVLP